MAACWTLQWVLLASLIPVALLPSAAACSEVRALFIGTESVSTVPAGLRLDAELLWDGAGRAPPDWLRLQVPAWVEVEGSALRFRPIGENGRGNVSWDLDVRGFGHWAAHVTSEGPPHSRHSACCIFLETTPQGSRVLQGDSAVPSPPNATEVRLDIDDQGMVHVGFTPADHHANVTFFAELWGPVSSWSGAACQGPPRLLMKPEPDGAFQGQWQYLGTGDRVIVEVRLFGTYAFEGTTVGSKTAIHYGPESSSECHRFVLDPSEPGAAKPEGACTQSWEVPPLPSPSLTVVLAGLLLLASARVRRRP